MDDQSSSKFNGESFLLYAKRLMCIVLGNLCCSIAVNAFFVPNHMLTGGVSGIGILIQYLTNGMIPAGISVFVINIPIFLLGFKRVDREFAISGFISMIILSFLMTFTRGVTKYFLVDDILLAAIFGGILNGLGMGILFRNKSSQGGLDVIAVILRRMYNMNIGSALMAINTIVISLSSFLFGYKPAMYTLIALFIGYNVLDKVRTGLNIRKKIIIISDKSDEIATAIIKKLHRGVTFLEGEGAYTHKDRKVIYCVVTTTEVARLKDMVDEIDPYAFITINEVVEVVGRGFKDMDI